jgi:hypothetical protein
MSANSDIVRWEYLFLTAEWDGQWRVRWHNDSEVPDWKAGPSLFASVDQLGEEGWELISTPEWPGAPDSHARRLIFKRRRV